MQTKPTGNQFPNSMHKLSRLVFIPLLVLSIISLAVEAQRPPPTPFTTITMLNQIRNNSNLNQEAGELWSWHANSSMGEFMRAYEAYEHPEFLDRAIEYFDYVVGEMREGADGYLGWIGPHVNNGLRNSADHQYRQDTHMGDAILTRHLLVFAEAVYNDPALHDRYLDKAREYVELVEIHLMEKWDARGTYHRAGDVGFYWFWDHYTTEDLSEWIQDTALFHSAVTQQFNKQTAMGKNALRLWRITGKESYRQRAIELYNFAKSRMQYYDRGYVWNFREPAMREDVASVQSNQVMTWIAVHPNSSGYQSSEVAYIVEAYHSGIVFDEEDIQRLLKTNLEDMWDGTSWAGTDANTHPNGRNTAAAGQRWSALEDFSQEMRDFVGELSPGDEWRTRIRHAHWHNVTLAREPGFDRKLLQEEQDIHVLDWPHGESRSMNMVFVTDPEFFPGEESTIAGIRTLRSLNLEIAVWDATGDSKVAVLETNRTVNGNSNYLFEWDGNNPATGQPLPAGDYRLRWTDAGAEGYREYPITILPDWQYQINQALGTRLPQTPNPSWIITNLGRVQPVGVPWVIHDGLGWCYLYSQGDSLWMWSSSHGWLWTNPDGYFPYLWNYEQNSWVYYLESRFSSARAPDAAWLYNFSTGQMLELDVHNE